MKLKKNIIFSFLFFTLIACESFKYEQIKFNEKNKTIELDSNSNFIIDSIIIRNEKMIFYSISNKGKGLKTISLTKKNIDYRVYADEYDKIHTNTKDEFIWLDIYIKKNGFNSKKRSLIDRELMQRFNMNYIPNEKIYYIDAIGRH